jgi:hypothetical protein
MQGAYMTWNYRIMRTNGPIGCSFQLVEVHYDEYGKPKGWNQAFLEGDSIEEIQELLDRALMGAAKPVVEFDK